MPYKAFTTAEPRAPADLPETEGRANGLRTGKRRLRSSGQVSEAQLHIALKPIGQLDMAVKGSYRVPSGVAHTQVLHRRVPRVGPGRRVVFYGIEIEMKQAVPVAGLSLGQADIRHHALQRLQGGVLRIEHLIEQIGRRGVTAHILRVKGYRPAAPGAPKVSTARAPAAADGGETGMLPGAFSS